MCTLEISSNERSLLQARHRSLQRAADQPLFLPLLWDKADKAGSNYFRLGSIIANLANFPILQ